jgi:pimeloyl-ACP methyl ester carboxylesterase
MTQPTLNYVSCPDAAGGHRMAYWQWGQPESAHVVLCVHGLTRQGRDFDVLAQALCEQAERSAQHPGGIRVVCVDVVGRGESDWLQDPAGYQVPFYAADMLVLLAQLHARSPIRTLDWVGTSMGGLIGMVVCGQPALRIPKPAQEGQEGQAAGSLPVAVRKLVLNDVGPVLQMHALTRIGAYLGQAGHFDTLQEAADAMWQISKSFGCHTPEQWLTLSRPMVRPVSPGTESPLRMHYDPAISLAFKSATQESAEQGQAMLWQLYEQITAQTLLLRGAASDLLSHETAQAMTQRGPRARLIEFEDVGHAPTLINPDQVAAVAGFLLDTR